MAIRSANNSSTTSLSGSGTFTGEMDQALEQSDVMTSCKCSKDCTLYYDFSVDDGLNWDTFPTNGFPAVMSNLRLNAEKIAGGSSPKVTFRLWAFSPVTNCNYLLHKELIDTTDSNILDIQWPKGLPLTEKDVAYVTATTNVDNTVVGATFSIVEIKNI